MNLRVVGISIGLLLCLTATATGQSAELEKMLDRLATSWARGDANALAALSAENGISFDLDGEPIGPLTRRQAAALLRSLFVGKKTDSLSSGMTRVVGGKPPRGFGELTWTMRAQGTTVPEKTKVFLALVWEDERWRITQIRLIR